MPNDEGMSRNAGEGAAGLSKLEGPALDLALRFPILSS
jgi:hypothetical protein